MLLRTVCGVGTSSESLLGKHKPKKEYVIVVIIFHRLTLGNYTALNPCCYILPRGRVFPPLCKLPLQLNDDGDTCMYAQTHAHRKSKIFLGIPSMSQNRVFRWSVVRYLSTIQQISCSKSENNFQKEVATRTSCALAVHLRTYPLSRAGERPKVPSKLNTVLKATHACPAWHIPHYLGS